MQKNKKNKEHLISFALDEGHQDFHVLYRGANFPQDRSKPFIKPYSDHDLARGLTPSLENIKGELETSIMRNPILGSVDDEQLHNIADALFVIFHFTHLFHWEADGPYIGLAPSIQNVRDQIEGCIMVAECQPENIQITNSNLKDRIGALGTLHPKWVELNRGMMRSAHLRNTEFSDVLEGSDPIATIALLRGILRDLPQEGTYWTEGKLNYAIIWIVNHLPHQFFRGRKFNEIMNTILTLVMKFTVDKPSADVRRMELILGRNENTKPEGEKKRWRRIADRLNERYDQFNDWNSFERRTGYQRKLFYEFIDTKADVFHGANKPPAKFRRKIAEQYAQLQFNLDKAWFENNYTEYNDLIQKEKEFEYLNKIFMELSEHHGFLPAKPRGFVNINW